MGLGHIMTLANSIIGVSVLAMPFCFKQCGIILSILVLFLSSIMTRLACHFLLKAAVLARRRNYEFLAFHAFGPKGKLVVELCIIGFLFGTCIAFFVVMGDLGPAIMSEVLGISNSPSVRSSVLLGLALLVVLPLGLLRNVDSLSSLCTATILFYFFLVLKIMSEATTHLLAGDWIQYVHLWRPAGILQCIPIFAMALSCQTQVFEIYETLPDPSLPKMNEVVRAAVNICTGVYVCMGFFGYVAVCRPPPPSLMDGVALAPAPALSGNILMSFPSSFAMQTIKLFFVASVACSFPLVIFPCRASLHSLLFRRAPHHESGMGISSSGGGAVTSSTASLLPPGSSGGQAMERIPERRFRLITISLVAGSLAVAFALPDIELVLGLVGSSIGTITCLLLPALCFLKVAPSHPYHHSHWGGGKGVTAERLLAQVMIVVGTTILVLSTYENLHAVDQARVEEPVTPHTLYESGIVLPKIPAGLSPGQSNGGDIGIPIPLPKVIQAVDSPKKVGHTDVIGDEAKNSASGNKKDAENLKEPPIVSASKQVKPEKRQEPPIPVAPDNKTKKKQQEGDDGDSKKDTEEKKKVDEEAEQQKQRVEMWPKRGEEERKEGGALNAKETADAIDSIHGDAIKKEEEEVGIEEGAAKREEERRREEQKRRTDEEEGRKREEKERKEKELLQKLADDRKKQQELINVQMEILKKLEALEGKKPESEKKEGGESQHGENVARTGAKKADGEQNLRKGAKEAVSKSQGQVKDGAPVGEGFKKGFNSSMDFFMNKAKIAKEQGNLVKDVSQNEVLVKKSAVSVQVADDVEVPVKAASSSKGDQLLIEKRKALNSSLSGQMKAAVPVPLLLGAGQHDSVANRKEMKAKERDKREVTSDIIQLEGNKPAKEEMLVSKMKKECEEGSLGNVDQTNENKGEEVVKISKTTVVPSKELPEGLTGSDVVSKDLQKTSGVKVEEVRPNVNNEAAVSLENAAVFNGAKEVPEIISIPLKDESVTQSKLLCTLGVKQGENYLSPTIQTPLRLTNPIGKKSAPNKVDPGVNLDGMMMESLPLRDLKYIKEVSEESDNEDQA